MIKSTHPKYSFYRELGTHYGIYVGSIGFINHPVEQFVPKIKEFLNSKVPNIVYVPYNQKDSIQYEYIQFENRGKDLTRFLTVSDVNYLCMMIEDPPNDG